ncbi:baculoviral IAP repeat-containing protein 6 isoform X2 [Bicyclus anynana]|uniref:Baculoviral IAP repeat-containing protein 6 isoform X2 n=1 Tax=Bicyclus anynana TaxID=110368 RepID=A0ABM3LY12_BICAN|nr:baculoviral IAP repeat-containing protein 6 isoform X2 [Bicyclus anynana]
MGDDSLILREDGYIRMNFPVVSLTYHSNLNVILVRTNYGGVHVLDVNTGVILQSAPLTADGVEYASGSDRVFLWDASGVGARTDYNGVLLLHTALQLPVFPAEDNCKVKIELVLSEAVLLYQCVQNLDSDSIEGLADFIEKLKFAIDIEPVRKGVKAQKWSTVTICLPHSTLRLVMISVVQDLKAQNRRIPALAIASAVAQRATDLMVYTKELKGLMYSEAERKRTFKRWPHMDYKWALPARMAQAGFYHQPSPSGDDRAMCFTCMVCLVCWEKSDEPWVEHERHSPNCPFVRGEYTHNVPISVTNATACAVPCPNVAIVSKGNTGDLIATGTLDGKVSIWKFDCGLKLVKYINLSPYDSIFSGILTTDYNKVWSASLEKDSSTYGILLTAMAFLGMESQQKTYPQNQNSEGTEKETSATKPKPSLVCAVIVTRTVTTPTNQPIKDDSSKALFDSGVTDKSQESIKAMNDQNEAKSNSTQSNKMIFLLTYDIHSSLAGSITTVVHTSNSSSGNSKPGGSKKVCPVTRTDDASIYDDIYLQYSDEDTELPQCTNTMLEEQISNVINLNASSSKEDCKFWEAKKIIFTKLHKALPPPPPTVLLPELPDSEQGSVLDFVGKISQIKSWKSGNLESAGTKVVDQTDAAPGIPIAQYLNMALENGPLEMPNLKWYVDSDGNEKPMSDLKWQYAEIDHGEKPVKLTKFGSIKVPVHGTQPAANNSNNDGFDSDPPQEEAVSQGVAVQCLSLPSKLNTREDPRVTHLLPVEDKQHLLVVISSIDPREIKHDVESSDSDTKMDVDEVAEKQDETDNSDIKAYFILYKINSDTSIYTLEDNPISYIELPYNESPVDVCLLPADKLGQYSFASVGIDGCLRLYFLPDFKVISEKRVPKGQFTSVVYCASVERLSVSTKHGVIYFYALNNGEEDAGSDANEDEFANLDFDMLQKASRDEVCGPTTAPTIIANKPELDRNDLNTLISLSGYYGRNTTVPYSAVVPGFWCELSPAQRTRSDHQNNRSWRLQNTSSTWDEHVLELTLPYSASLAHIEFGFTLQFASSENLPVIQVTLLKQNLHGIGYKKDASFGLRPDSPVQPVVDEAEAEHRTPNLEHPVNSEEYLQSHNAEILAGPLFLSSGLDATQQSGTLILTSPRLYRARGRTFLIHIKTLFDPDKEMCKGPVKVAENSSKKFCFIGCDWLHQISITVRSCPQTLLPMEKQQRIAMLESNNFLNNLCKIVISKDDILKRKYALDLIIWVISIRLQRMRLAKYENNGKEKDAESALENQQLECVEVIKEHTEAMIKNCILCGNRSIAKKCVKIMLITLEGVKELPRRWKTTFEETLVTSVTACVPLVGACESPGALKWLMALAQHCTSRARAPALLAKGFALLEKTARCLRERADPYHHLLRARFGLYGLPLESTRFGAEVPELVRGSTAPVTYASVLAGEPPAPAHPPPQYLLKDMLNQPLDSEGKANNSAWWGLGDLEAVAAGLGEATPLHVTCHLASDGTKLETAAARHPPTVVSAHSADPHQLWTMFKEGNFKNLSQDPDSLDDVESSLMECDPQEKMEFTEEKLFKDGAHCGIPWATLVTRSPQHTLFVERMHSGARRYIVLDFGRHVRLTDVVIPACSDLVTLYIDIWAKGEETDCEKLAYATDINTKHLVLTDIQPPAICRYMKITTIGRYGMAAMKCKIPLGWFYGEIVEIDCKQASVNALKALYEDLSCRFRLATGKLVDLLNPYLDLYNGNAAHMMAYLNQPTEADPKVIAAYQECIELQQQLHNCNNILKGLQETPDTNEQVLDMLDKGKVTPESLLETASTDKLRVITENVIDLLLYFVFQMDVEYTAVSAEWCRGVVPLSWEWGGRFAAGAGALLAQVCGSARWWGPLLADTLAEPFERRDAPPQPLDRCLVAVMYMARKSMYAHGSRSGGVTHALCARTLELMQGARPQPALLAVMLTALASVLDAAVSATTNPPTKRNNRWDWVTGGKARPNTTEGSAPSPRSAECKLHRRKLHKKLLHQMQELEAARRGIQVALEEQQRARVNLKARMAMICKRGGGAGSSRSSPAPSGSASTPRADEGVKLISPTLGGALAHALVAHMLAMDSTMLADHLLLSAKVVGRLCALCGDISLLAPSCILGLARLAVTLPPWSRHAVTTLMQDLVEQECGELPLLPTDEWGGSGSSRVTRVVYEGYPSSGGKAPRNTKKLVTVADKLADSFGLEQTWNAYAKSKINASNLLKDMDDDLAPQLAESDDSECEEKLEQYFFDGPKKESRCKTIGDGNNCLSTCVDARLENGAASAGEAFARRVLAATAAALPLALRAPPTRPAEDSPSDTPADSPPQEPPPLLPQNPPLAHTLYDVFRHLALEFPNQTDCTLLENVLSLWLILNGSAWGGAWALGALTVPADAPRVRLASDTVVAVLRSLTQLEHVSLRCWVLSMQALAWIATLPLQTEGLMHTMARVILECEYFVPALVKFISIDVTADGAVITSEPYLGGAGIGAGAGAASALQSVLSRVVKARGALGALVSLRVLTAIWTRPANPSAAPPVSHSALDLHAALLRAAHSLLPALTYRQVRHALPLIEAIADQCGCWIRESSGWRPEPGGGGGNNNVPAGGEARLSGLLADVLAGNNRRAPLRRAVLQHLLLYSRRLLALPLPPPAAPAASATPAAGSGTQSSATSPGGTGGDISQTDESKAQNSAVQDGTNMEDERKQQAPKTPCLADTVLQHPEIMQKFYKTLSVCDGMNALVLSMGGNGASSAEQWSLKEEVFWLVAKLPALAANPTLMLPSLMEYLRKDETVKLSQGMQQLIVRALERPELLAAFVESGGLELALDKLAACHQAGPSSNQGLVSSLMNHLKLPPQLVNMSIPASGSKKSQPPVLEAANGLINIAPLCTVTCGNPTAQSADVLLGGSGASGACAARRVRAAAWSYHFFSADDASLTVTINLPYAAALHEVHLQPHLTSLATCPGAVGVEAGCGGTVAPLGAPQNTAGMTFIRLVLVRPVIVNTVTLRLYKPRDSSNMGLLQLRLLTGPAFAASPDQQERQENRWARIVWECTRTRLESNRWAALGSAGAVSALCSCVVAGGGAAQYAHRALLAAARAEPALRDPLVTALLNMDAHAHAHAFQPSAGKGAGGRWAGSMGGVCALAAALCRWCPQGSVHAYVRWLAASAERALRDRAPPSAALVHTLAAVLWTLKEERLLENLEEMITEGLFELIYTWVKDVPESNLLKKSLDAVLCSMCYIRPELFKLLLEQMEIPMDTDESMEGLTDDTKVGRPTQASTSHESSSASEDSGMVARLRGWQLRTVAAAAMSPAATLTLLHCPLPAALVRAVANFSEAKLALMMAQSGSGDDVHMTDSDSNEYKRLQGLPSMKSICDIVEWARLVCAERRVKEWLGGDGAAFWRPLLRLLCHPRPQNCTWQESAQYAQLEESTIRLFAELTVCHTANQKLFASTLHSILYESMQYTGPDGLSGFTRALILRLVLSGERATVALRWAGGAGAAGGAGSPALPPHAAPPHPAAAHHTLHLPLHTTVRTLLQDHRPQMPLFEEASRLCAGGSAGSGAGGPGAVLRSASDPNITVAEAWELSLAAASASKDKRVKDVKNTSLKQQGNKKRQSKASNDTNTLSVSDEIIESTIRVQVEGLEGFIPPSTTLAQLTAAVPHVFGPHLTLNLHINTSGEPWTGPMWEGGSEAGAASGTCAGGTVLREFGACGGLALVAARLPRPHAAPAPPPAPAAHHDLDWVKLDDVYEEVVEMGVTSAGTVGGSSASSEEAHGCAGVPAHALVALALLLKLPGYAAALLDEGARAVHLLRLLLGVAHDEEGHNIVVGGSNGGNGAASLGTLPFRVVAQLLEAAPRAAPAGRSLRVALLQLGAVRLVLACLAVFTHHRPTAQNSQNSNGSSKDGTREEKAQLYWAKGTGFGTGSTQQSWNVEQALVRQRLEEEHVTVLLQVLVSYMNPGEKWPPEEGSQEESEEAEESEEGDSHELPAEFIDLVASSSLVPAICSYLRNDSVLDMSRHIPLYVSVLRAVRALRALRCRRLAPALRALPRLLASMSRTTNSYATKLRMSKKNIFGKMTYSQRFSTSSTSELSEEDEGLALLIADIQATSALVCRSEGEAEGGGIARPLHGATREARYIDLMRTMQFETFEMMAESTEGGFRFTVPYHFEATVRAAGERAHPARMKRLAQEAATLATSLPLSYSSSVFVRTDTDRLDVMKVLITGPSDTPYANGCFILDVYFPAEYPAVPMLINLETTGRHSVRFNPNLYNDGKVCLSVLNTWHGRPEEKWNAHTSSFLQVLVSIQSLILVPEPYFNEPGYERSRGTRVGNSASLEYNSNIYQACVRWAMLDHLRAPESCFKEVIQTHFWIKRNEIMQTVANWITELEGQTGDERTQRNIQLNLMALKRHYVKLHEELARLPMPPGLDDLDEPFKLPAVPPSPPMVTAASMAAALAAQSTTPAPVVPDPATPQPPQTSDEIDHDMEKIVAQVLD